MAENSEVKMSLKLMVDSEKNQVVFAEADKHFVDVLFSFLTLPLGTILRLLGEESQIASIWSLTNLYKGVDELDPEYFSSEECKTMLLRPMNAAGHLCKKLKLNIDDTEPIKYFCCTSNYTEHLSLFECGTSYRFKEIELLDDDKTTGTGGDDGVFIKSQTTFIVTDNLLVMPYTFDSIHLLLDNLGIREIGRLREMTLEIGLKEVTLLLELSLLSESPLTEMFLRKDKLHVACHFLAPKYVGNISETLKLPEITIKLMYRKSDYKVLYAEAKEDFIDFLFSILTLPLGTVVELFCAASSWICIDNLYSSVKNPDVERLLKSDFHKATLLSPYLPPTYKCKNQPLDVHEMNSDFDYYKHASNWQLVRRRKRINGHFHCHDFRETVWLDPKDPSETARKNGYVREPANFMVTDDLIVKPLSFSSTIGLLNSLGVEFSTLVQREISIGREEALCLLKASLCSTSALTSLLNLNSIFHEPKQEI